MNIKYSNILLLNHSRTECLGCFRISYLSSQVLILKHFSGKNQLYWFLNWRESFETDPPSNHFMDTFRKQHPNDDAFIEETTIVEPSCNICWTLCEIVLFCSELQTAACVLGALLFCSCMYLCVVWMSYALNRIPRVDVDVWTFWWFLQTWVARLDPLVM